MDLLLVSDKPQVSRQVTSAFLGEDDVDIVEVGAPQRALDLLDEGRSFDVVIAEADTTPMGGMALSREVKARAGMGRDMPPVVLLIAREQDRWLAKWSQADACVLKPVDSFDLAAVAQALAEGEPVPALPGVWAEPVPDLLKMPGPPAPSRVEGGPEDVAAEDEGDRV
ncbi:MAG TPA: response regulator [Egibacteraceae bacterium]|nr:response regulator [Egibacteraceae bacterium]